MEELQSFWKKTWKNKRVKFFAKTGVSAILFFWVVMKVDWKSAWGYVEQVRISFLLLYVMLLFLGMGISSYKWRILTRYKGFKKSFRWHFQTYLAGTFVNNFFPSTIGGDAYRILELGVSSDGKRSPAVSTIFFDRLTGLWALALLGCIFSLFQYQEMIQHFFWVLVVVVMGLFLVADIFLTFDSGGVFTRWGRRISESFGNLLEEMEKFRDRKVVARTFSFSIIFMIVGVGFSNYVLFHAFGLPIGIWQFLSVIFVINAVSALPISVNNIGIKEWAYFIFFGYLGLSTDVAVTVAIVSRFVQMLLSFLALPGYIKGKRR